MQTREAAKKLVKKLKKWGISAEFADKVNRAVLKYDRVVCNGDEYSEAAETLLGEGVSLEESIEVSLEGED